MDDLKRMQVIAWKRGYGRDYVDHFVKLRKKNMREFARKSGIRNPIDVRLDKWGSKRRRALEEDRTRKAAMEEQTVPSSVIIGLRFLYTIK